MTSVLISLIVVSGVLIFVGCCIIPYVRGLTQWLIETALTKQLPPPYENNLVLLETQEHESQWLLNDFEEKNLS
jgi:hypothetical protein